ncbi:uncharacterized protein L969DRAFT_93882 [Mixia osmundae IAM 14324]|uniref:Ergosterol biosynthesis protein n=1 Tax=Mixia osmundae (strain CBS 9802 / IAM 14324 / JCM 22182 / KY 12970) TaxID=764103 RepID=G7E9V2_MIXOS|nr:uncharacterized protein L969DRAFT_93882 [Mixia osmundae IAM 14324]KEI40053.1 hypothetical protein L969DRAFT_93882 [Mixia osmundae IAM 14324]GAA99421.1 hypothetical protein E5Q_06119 [Mixia osmundae IAM 14324]
MCAGVATGYNAHLQIVEPRRKHGRRVIGADVKELKLSDKALLGYLGLLLSYRASPGPTLSLVASRFINLDLSLSFFSARPLVMDQLEASRVLLTDYAGKLPSLSEHGGLLPQWLLFVSVLALFNTVQNFVTNSLTRRVYHKTHVTSLQSRTFAVWTLTSAGVRLYTAMSIDNPALYHLTLASFVIAFLHFGSEIVVFKTTTLFSPALSTVIISTSSMYWMMSQYDYYLSGLEPLIETSL